MERTRSTLSLVEFIKADQEIQTRLQLKMTNDLLQLRFELIDQQVLNGTSHDLVFIYHILHQSINHDETFKMIDANQDILQTIIHSITILTSNGKQITQFDKLIENLIKLNNHQAAKLLIDITKFSSPQLQSNQLEQIINHFIHTIGHSNLNLVLDYSYCLIVYGYIPSISILIQLINFLTQVIGLDSNHQALIEQAKASIKHLIRSPSHQAISSLIIILDQKDSSAIIGSIRCLSDAFKDYDSLSNHDLNHQDEHQLRTSLSLLSLGLLLIKKQLLNLISSPPSDHDHIHHQILLLLIHRFQSIDQVDQLSSSFKSDNLNSIFDLIIAFLDHRLSIWLQQSSPPTHHPLHPFSRLFSIIFSQFTSPSLQPLQAHYHQLTINKYFRLVIPLYQHLPPSFKLTLLDQIDSERVCGPEHAQWISNLTSLLNGFFNFLPHPSLTTPHPPPTDESTLLLSTNPLTSLDTQLRLLRLISDVFLTIRDFDHWRQQLLDQVIFPTLTRILLLHYYPPFDDAPLVDLSMNLIQDILQNELINDLLDANNNLTPSPPPPPPPSPNSDTFDTFRKLLLRVATVDRFYESAQVNEFIQSQLRPSDSAPSIPASNPQTSLSSPSVLTPSISPSKPATTTTTISISSPKTNTNLTPKPIQHHPACLKRREKLSYKAVINFIKLFQHSLSISTAYSNFQCAAIFKHLVPLLRPAQDPHLTSSLPTHSPSITGNFLSFDDLDHHLQRTGPPITLNTPAKLAILKCFVRLRADEEHRIQFVRDVDISGLASIIGRVVDPRQPPPDPRAHDRKKVWTPDQSPLAASPTAFQHLKSRSMSVTTDQLVRRPSVNEETEFVVLSRKSIQSGFLLSSPTSPASHHHDTQLWSVPEKLEEMEWPELIRTQATHSLVTFDHVTRKDWDPSPGQIRSQPTAKTSCADHHHSTHHFTVLPISEYLGALISILRYETEWELVSYILCHLPGQLSNKHFACGPNASQQIHQLRRFLCSGFKLDKLLHQVRFPPRQKVKLTDAHAITYQTLSTLIAYKALFHKSQADELVGSFVTGLGKYKDTSKACVHALSLSCHELPLSITKYLPDMLRGLMKIVSSDFLSLHILELLGFLGQMPTLYANLTEVEFRLIFGIALQYITNHNQQVVLEARNAALPAKTSSQDSALSSSNFEADEDVQLACRQYVYFMAFYIIALWFVSLKLADRKKYVTFITRKLIQACESKKVLDEPTEVCFDMLNRYAYSNAEPKPRKKHSKFNELFNSSLGKPIASSSWIIGSSVLTIKCFSRPGWTEVVVKRPSGMVKMVWELENLSGDHAVSELDILNMVLRHRDTLYAAVSDEDGLSSDYERERPIGDVEDEAPDDGRSVTLESVMGLSTEITRSTGIKADYTNLVVEPSFFALQLLPFSDPSSWAAAKPIRVPDLSIFQQSIELIDYTPVVDFHKVGVIYVAPGQKTEKEILGNKEGSQAYINFLSAIGTLIRLRGCEHYYTGGMDTKNDDNGKFGYVWGDDITQVCFHVSTLMPSTPEESGKHDPLLEKKALIGNDFVVIVFNDSGSDYRFDCIASQFNFINIIIEPNTGGSGSGVAGLTTELKFYKISLQRKVGLPPIGPIENFKMISSSCLSSFVRRLALHANTFVQVYLASGGGKGISMGTGKVSAPKNLEYVSHWRYRLRHILRLKDRVCKFHREAEQREQEEQGEHEEVREEASGGGVGVAGSSGVVLKEGFDVDELVKLRDFTRWT